MLIFWIAISILLFLVIFFLVVRSNKKKKVMAKVYTAAGNILREEFLNYSLQNNLPGQKMAKPSTKKMMLYIEARVGKTKKRYVFDPDNMIYFGRNEIKSNIYIDNIEVSKDHCVIYSKNENIYLQDCGSSNGSIIKRGIFKKYILENKQYIELYSKDRLIIGDNEFIINLFYYDLTQM